MPHRLPCIALVAATVAAAGCAADPEVGVDPATAPRAVVDRFSAAAGHLQVRTADNGLPAADAPIDFDQGPFVTQGRGPRGEVVRYYNFDVQPTTPDEIYVLFEDGADAPVPGQLNIVDSIPGDAGYNDFWRIVRVDVPVGYVANAVTSHDELVARGYAMTPTDAIVNCPVVPDGSTATHRLGGESTKLHLGWYRDQVVSYFTFEEKALHTLGGAVPASPIFVTFNVNPDQPGGGPASGFRTEPGTAQTHNVVATTPSDAAYSPLWSVQVYDTAEFDAVGDLASAQAATVVAPDVATVNCPLFEVRGA